MITGLAPVDKRRLKIDSATFQLTERLEKIGVSVGIDPVSGAGPATCLFMAVDVSQRPVTGHMHAVLLRVLIGHDFIDHSTVFDLASECRRRLLIATIDEDRLWKKAKPILRQIANVILSLENE